MKKYPPGPPTYQPYGGPPPAYVQPVQPTGGYGPMAYQSRPAYPPTQNTLHIYSSSSGGRILGGDKTSVLYTYKTHAWSTSDIEFRAGSGAPIGDATFHSFSSRVDLTLHGRSVSFESNGAFSSGHHMQSFAPGSGGSLKWKDGGAFTHSKICTSGQGGELARYEASAWAVQKAGKLHLFGPAAVQGPLMDEIVLGILVEMLKASRGSSAAGAGA